jgi:hypothetical protein
MAKPTFESNPRVQHIFKDLEKYKEFCVDFGYKFDEATLYDMRNYVYRQHSKQLSGKYPRNIWDEDTRPS